MRLAPLALLWMTAIAAAEDPAPAADASPIVTPARASVPPGGPSIAPSSPTVATDAARPDRNAQPRATRAGIVLELRSDFGFARDLDVEFSNDRRASMELNDGLGISAGASFLPLAKGQLATRATVGVKFASLRAQNGSALFIACPVELMEAAYAGPLRFGAGLSVLLAPRVRGDGIFEHASASFGPAPGAVLDAEWIVSTRTRTGVGIRASWYRFSAQGAARGAPAFGLVLRSDFDVSGR